MGIKQRHRNSSLSTIISEAFRIGLIVFAVIAFAIGAVVWYVIGQLVVGYARMEAGERLEESAPSSPSHTSEDHPH